MKIITPIYTLTSGEQGPIISNWIKNINLNLYPNSSASNHVGLWAVNASGNLYYTGSDIDTYWAVNALGNVYPYSNSTGSIDTYTSSQNGNDSTFEIWKMLSTNRYEYGLVKGDITTEFEFEDTSKPLALVFESVGINGNISMSHAQSSSYSSMTPSTLIGDGSLIGNYLSLNSTSSISYLEYSIENQYYRYQIHFPSGSKINSMILGNVYDLPLGYQMPENESWNFRAGEIQYNLNGKVITNGFGTYKPKKSKKVEFRNFPSASMSTIVKLFLNVKNHYPVYLIDDDNNFFFGTLPSLKISENFAQIYDCILTIEEF